MLFVLLSVLNAYAATTPSKTSNCDDVKNYADVSLPELQNLVNQDKVFLIDANSAESFKEHYIGKENHIAKDHVVNFGAVEKNLATALPPQKDTLIVAYCGGLKCVAWQKAAKAACKLHYTNIKHFAPGITGWVPNNKS